MHRLRLLGLNHTTAPLTVRERLAFAPAAAAQASTALARHLAPCEVVVLSTCNRVEIYTGRDEPPPLQQIIQYLADLHGVPASAFDSQLYEKTGRDAVAHLFSVTASLDSMVLGETQILGQVREAYDAARAAGATGKLLNPLFQRALAAGKQVLHETNLAEGRVSVASVAVDYARGIFDHFQDKALLCIGAGEMVSLVLQHFAELKPGRVTICNRDARKAAALAAQFGGSGADLSQLADALVAADVIIACTGADEPIVTRPLFESLRKKRRYRPAFMLDLAVPRDVEASVGDLEGVYLYNLDDLQTVVAQTRSQRTEALVAAQAIVDRHVSEFDQWMRRRELGPAIEALYERYHTLAREELARTLAKMEPVDPATRAQLEEMVRRTVNKLLHDPVEALRVAEDSHAPAAQYIHAMEKLFKLTAPSPSDPERDG